MMSTRMHLGAACLLVCLGVTGAAAQTLAPAQQRPTNGIFGHTREGDQSLGLTVSLTGGFDENIAAAEPGLFADPYTQQSGSHEELTTALAYDRRFGVVGVSLAGRSALRYYPSLTDVLGAQHALSAGLSATFTKTRFAFSQSANLSPFYAFSNQPALFESRPGELPAVASDQAAVRSDMRSYSSSVNFTHSFNRRLELAVQGTFQRSDFVTNGDQYRDGAAWGRLEYHVTRDIGLVGGYGLEQAEYRYGRAPGDTTTMRTVNLGIDYNKSLSMSRRTTVGFTTGSVAFATVGGPSQFRLTGSARLNHDFGRTWHSTAAFTHGASMMTGFSGPFFGDVVALSVGGYATRRVDLSFMAAYSSGEIGVAVIDSHSTSYNATAHLRVALTRLLAVSGEYLYYRYAFDQTAQLPLDLPSRLNRQGVRVGLDLWLPLVR